METAEVIDYAMPLMNIERMAKQAHDLCLEKRFAEAREVALKIGSESRVLSVTLILMQEKESR